PLSVASYSTWRNSLAHRRESVSRSVRKSDNQVAEYTLQTSTSDSELREASITLAAPELVPVRCHFVFKDDAWLEVSIVPESGGDPPVPVPSNDQHADRDRDTAERELKVRLAIDQLSADAGLPVTVEVDSVTGSIAVTPYGLAPDQEAFLKIRLQPIDSVTL